MARRNKAQKILVTGASGFLGSTSGGTSQRCRTFSI